MADGRARQDMTFKWSRNLREESLTETNRLKLIEKQKQLLQSKRARQPQVTATSSSETPLSRLYKGSSLTGTNVSSNERLIDLPSEKESLSGIVNEALVPDNDSCQLDSPIVQTTKSATSSAGKTTAPAATAYTGLNKQRTMMKKNNSEVDTSDSDSLDSSLDEIYSDQVEQLSKDTTSSRDSFITLDKHDDHIKLDKHNSLDDDTLRDDVKVESTSRFNPLTTIPSKSELLTFAHLPLPINKLYQCTIIRDKRGLDQSFYPTYFMYLQSIVSRSNGTFESNRRIDQPSNGKQILTNTSDLNDEMKSKYLENSSFTPGEQANRHVFLMCGRRRKKSRYYSISLDPFDISKSNSIGKLKYNLIGTQFTFYRRLGPRQSVEDATITYDANILGFKGPRKMSVTFADPAVRDTSTGRTNKGIIQLKNKIPVWNEESQSYVLNFHGRVTQASVKNFQLVQSCCDDSPCESNVSKDQNQMWFQQQQQQQNKLPDVKESPDDSIEKLSASSNTSQYAPTQPVSSPSHSLPLDTEVVMQFGRVSDKEFTCDIRYPLSPFQAFAIALSSFDSKLACE